MLYGLLMEQSTILLALEYAVCLLLVLLSLLGFIVVRRRTNREMNAWTVKKHCLKARETAVEMLDDNKHKSAYVLLAASKLVHLSGQVADAAWYAYQIVSVKKDILYEGVATSLDVLATEISNASQEGYIQFGEYKACVEKTIRELDAALTKLNELG